MTRRFKTAGVLVAVVAMFALTASSASATFTSANYPATVSGSSSGDVIDLLGSTATCTNNTFTGTLAKADTTLTVTPVYLKCTAFGLPATVAMTGCDYLLHTGGGSLTVDLLCEGTKTPDITVYTSSTHGTAICHVTVTPFTGKGGLTATTNGNHVDIKGQFIGIVAHQVRTNFLCPPVTTEEGAKYTVQGGGITMAGNNGAFSVS